MTYLFSWLQVTTVIYVLTAVTSPVSTLGSLLIPWWLWGCILGICYLINVMFVHHLTKLIHFVVLQLVFLSLIELGLFGYYQITVGKVWPGILPGFFEILIAWSAVSYIILRPLNARQRVWFWEVCIACTCLMVYLDSSYRLSAPFVSFSPYLVIALGLVNESLIQRGLSGASRFIYILRLTIFFAAFITAVGVLFVSGLSALKITSLISILQVKISLWVSLILKLFEQTNINRGMESVNPLVNVQGSVGSANGSTWGGSAPLWIMITLWTLLALSILLVIIYIIVRLKELFINIRAMEINVGSNKPQFWNLKKGLLLIMKSFVDSFSSILIWIKAWIRQILGIKPNTTIDLYIYFLWWTGRMGFKPFKFETSREYCQRITSDKRFEGLIQELRQLTEAYNEERYGSKNYALGEDKIRSLYLKLQKPSNTDKILKNNGKVDD